MYIELERTADKLGIRYKRESADKVIRQWLFKERVETGRIYLFFVDNVQRQTVFDIKNFPIYQSNLCQEILLPTLEFGQNPTDNDPTKLVKIIQDNQYVIKHMDYEVPTINRGLVKVKNLTETDELNLNYCKTIYNL